MQMKFIKDTPLFLLGKNNNRADFYDNQGQYDEALKDYATAIEISTDDDETARAINNRAIIYGEQGKYELQIAEYTKAIAINPDDPLYYSNRAISYGSLEDYENALLDLTKTIELDKKNPERYLYVVFIGRTESTFVYVGN